MILKPGHANIGKITCANWLLVTGKITRNWFNGSKIIHAVEISNFTTVELM